MARETNIREEVAEYLETPFRLCKETDSALGPTSEEDKLERARRAIGIWWRVFDRLLLWAQAQIVGEEWTATNPELADALSAKRKQPITENSHELEHLGFLFLKKSTLSRSPRPNY